MASAVQKRAMRLDLRWLDKGWRGMFLLGFRAELQKLDAKREPRTEKAVTAILHFALGDRLHVRGSTFVITPPPSKNTSRPRELVRSAHRRGHVLFLRYGEAPELRQVRIQKIEPWGFVAETEEGFRSFRWNKILHLQNSFDLGQAFERLDLHWAEEAYGNSCDACAQK